MASYFLNHEDFYSNNTSYYYWPAFLASSSNSSSATNLTGVYDSVVSDVVGSLSHEYQKWLFSITGCLLVGLSGVFPLLIFPNGECSFNSSSSSKTGAKDKATTDSTGKLSILIQFLFFYCKNINTLLHVYFVSFRFSCC